MRVMVLGCGFHGRGIAYQIAAEVETVDGVLAHGIVTQADSVMWPDASDASGVGEFVVANKGLSR